MRLIDADVLEKIMTEDWFLHILISENNMQEAIKNCIDSVPLAYDVEKVAELAMYQEIGTIDECAEMQVQYNYLSAKIKKYEAIGTVEEIQLLVSKGRAYDQVAWERDIAIEQLAEFGLSFGQKTDDVRIAVERMKPKKPIKKNGYCIAKDTDGNRIYREQNYCPSCGYDITNFQYGFCISCGQAIDME